MTVNRIPIRIIGVLMLAGLFLVACGSSGSFELEELAATRSSVATDVVPTKPSGPEPANDATVAPAEVSSQEPAAPPPTPRTSLDSTNPRDVSLASGELQFVEFFAHW